jgi:hypothetical protein
MSYVIHLVPQTMGHDPLAEIHSLLEQNTEETNPGFPIKEKEEKKKRLAKLLIKSNPNFTPFKFGFSDIAKKHNWTEEEARIRFRHIELNVPDGFNTLQITLYDDTVDIAIPYWYQTNRANEVFKELWKYLNLLVLNGNFLAYDPQLDRILDLSKDYDEVIKRYDGVMKKVPDMTTESAQRNTFP